MEGIRIASQRRARRYPLHPPGRTNEGMIVQVVGRKRMGRQNQTHTKCHTVSPYKLAQAGLDPRTSTAIPIINWNSLRITFSLAYHRPVPESRVTALLAVMS